MKKNTVILAILLVLTVVARAEVSGNSLQPVTRWESPPEDLLKVLHAPQLPWVWTAPSGKYLLLTDPVQYPPLAELAAPMHPRVPQP